MSDLLAWLAEPFAHRFVWRGLVVAVLLGISAGMVGCVLVLRRLSLMADSFGHSLLPGVGIAYLLVGPSIAALFTGAVVAGLFTALMSGVVSRLTRLKEDAAFGALFVVCFALGVAIMSKVAAPADMLHYLFGTLLGVTAADCALAAGVSGLTVLAFAVFYRPILIETFDPAFHRSSGGRSTLTHLGVLALTVLNLVAALQTVGMVLSLGLFILPAVTAYLWCERFGAMLAFSAIYGAVGASLGLYLSCHTDLASGSAMVCCLGSGFIVSIIASPRHGVIARLMHRHRHQHEESEEVCDVPTPEAHRH